MGGAEGWAQGGEVARRLECFADVWVERLAVLKVWGLRPKP